MKNYGKNNRYTVTPNMALPLLYVALMLSKGVIK